MTMNVDTNARVPYLASGRWGGPWQVCDNLPSLAVLLTKPALEMLLDAENDVLLVLCWAPMLDPVA